MVYEPHEDSYFLADFVKEHARGDVLDMCTGTGVQAFAALQNPDVASVVAVDIDPEAIERVMQSRYPIETLTCDLFADLKDRRFDTIICNPPYLPREEKDDDPALYGGQEGYEFTLKFLEGMGAHLEEGGNVLLLFSSLTNRGRIDQRISDLGYHAELLGELAMFFERLYVYRIFR